MIFVSCRDKRNRLHREIAMNNFLFTNCEITRVLFSHHRVDCIIDNSIPLARHIERLCSGVDKFGMIYEQQRKGVAYESPQEMLQNLGTTTDNLAPMLDLSVRRFPLNSPIISAT